MTQANGDWHPDRSLIRELNAHLDGPRESWAEVHWEQLADVIARERGAMDGVPDDQDFLQAVLQHAVLLALVRGGIPGLGPREAQRLATLFPEPDQLARADAAEMVRLVPGLELRSVKMAQKLFGG